MREVCWRLPFLVAIAALFAATVPACATEATLLADAHVSSTRPDVNSGSISNLYVGAGYTSLLQFDLSPLPSGTTAAQVSKAVLRVFCNRVDTAGLVSVQTVGGSWGEYSVTYSTLPPLGSATQVFQVSQAGAYLTVDVTAVVQGWLQAPATNNGLALTAGTAAVQFDSKENDLTSHGATLDISLTAQGGGSGGAAGPAGPAGPQGPAGATGPAGPAGAAGAAGPKGDTGAAGPAGAAGVMGPAGPQGLAGGQGPQGNPGLGYVGVYQSSSNYGLADVVGYQGSSYISLVASNHGNTPSLSPAQWGVIAQAQVGPAGPAGATGPAGAAGLPGPQGSQGATGLPGAAGAQGPQGLPGMTYAGQYAAGTNYNLGDVVLWNGASYSSLLAGNRGNTPDASPLQWGVLTAQGQAGPTGAMGPQGVAGPQGAPGSVGPPGERGDQGAPGVAGQAGAQGVPGVAGPQGAQGPTGPQGIAGTPGLVFRGNYSSSANYGVGDGVMYGGAGYVSLTGQNIGNTPDASPVQWAMFAAAGTSGAAGAAGVAGPQGLTGPQGPAGVAGPAGPTGATGAQGPAVANYKGAYSSAVNYGANDAVSYGGSTFISLTTQNVGNQPDQSSQQWAVLAGQGATGPAGATGAAGPAGPAGATGATGAQGPPVSFAGSWVSGRAYAVGDAVSYGGSSYIAAVANSGRSPDVSPMFWGLLAQSGNAGPVGPAGPQGATGPTGVGIQGPAGPQGATGATGTIGPAGATGPAGAAGPAGPTGAAGAAGIAYRGSYNSATTYGLNDAVTYGGGSYLSTGGANLGNTPDANPAVWSVLAAAGTNGAAGATGATGAQGLQGLQGAAGPQGPAGVPGVAGADGAAGLRYAGAFSAGANYALNDAVVYGGSTYISLQSLNRGNTPDQSPSWWGVLAQAGAAGPTGATGAAGAAGATGATGATGAAGLAGPTGPAGRPGLTYRGTWNSATSYQVGDAVLFQGTTYVAEMINSASEPDAVAAAWSVLAQQGSAGPTGPTGAGATVQIGTVTTGAAGSSATVTNVGTAGAAVLNFSIPQGAAGADGSGGGGNGGGGGTSGIAFQSTYHAVSYNSLYYSVNNANGAYSEAGGAMLTWVPGGCTATKLAVYSQQASAITVTLRQGLPGALANTTLACTVSANSSCTAAGAIAVASGSFVDLMITGSNGTAAAVWTALACN